jgi:hypothetical protein
MARPVSSIESHPQRQKIIDALINNQTLQQIAAWTEPKVTESAICRWRRKITLQTANAISKAQTAITNRDNGLEQDCTKIATQAAMAVAVDPFLARVAQLRQERAEVKLEARSDGDLRTWATLDRNDLSELELHARLAGRLDTATSSLTIQLVSPAVPQAAAPATDDITVIDITAGE